MAAPAAGAAPAPVPAPARSLLRLVVGGPGTALWDVVQDSPLVSALPFVGWTRNAAGTHFEAPRSELVGVLLSQADRPAAATLPAFDAFSLVEHEMGAAHGSTVAHLLDKSGASPSMSLEAVPNGGNRRSIS